ncbi:MAG: ligase-associated DNA damage response DEXH box helicase [Gemmataceae bacterium]
MNSLKPAMDWFKSKDWKPFPFQKEVWNNYLKGTDTLLHSTTGSGKTQAAWFGPLLEYISKNSVPKKEIEPIRVLWITPLRALSGDTISALSEPIEFLKLPWTIEKRTSDTTTTQKRKQKEKLPTCLVTTPESLCLLLSYPQTQERFQTLKCIVIDEWHEFLSSKRGVQIELALARLRKISPEVRTIGLSATLGNLESAAKVLSPSTSEPKSIIVEGKIPKTIQVECLFPDSIQKFPWAGHLGTQMIQQVADSIEEVNSSLVFTNTRFQAENWYQSLLKLRPDWAGIIALHHGSLDQKKRTWVENALKNGSLKAVVCTSSMDLGVDYQCVERVFQIGSPKGVSRLIQRAGRSGHQPGKPSTIFCVPTHAMEFVEIAAARQKILEHELEERIPVEKPLDVLSQHAVTLACSDGFEPAELFKEIRSTWSFRNLDPIEWKWVLDFISFGGETLRAYDDFKKVSIQNNRFYIRENGIASRHRMCIGTILSDASILVQFLRGPRIGTVEESFLSRLKPGDCFSFAGKHLELVRIKDMKAYVKTARRKKNLIPRWNGGKMPLSTQLAEGVRHLLHQAGKNVLVSREMAFIEPLLNLQKKLSSIPHSDELLVENLKSRDGYHLFVFAFAGRLVHEGLCALIAHRISRNTPITFTMTANDYGFELLSSQPIPVDSESWFSTARLHEDISNSVNTSEMARRHFREIARISCLVMEGIGKMKKTSRQLQASSGLLFDVFSEYDKNNQLLAQAKNEVLEKQLDYQKLKKTLEELSRRRTIINIIPRPTPLSLPLMADRIRDTTSSESLAERIIRMQKEMIEG